MANKKKKSGRLPEIGNVINTGFLIRILLIVLFIGVIIYSVVSLSNINIQLAQKNEELRDIQNQIEVQEIKNEEMNKLYNYSGDELSDYIEQLARDELDYIKQGERVFVNVSGD